MKKNQIIIILTILTIVISGCQKKTINNAKLQQSVKQELVNVDSTSSSSADMLLALATSEIDASDWLTYKNDKYGFEFNYPKKWGEPVKQGLDERNLNIAFSGNGCIDNCPTITVTNYNVEGIKGDNSLAYISSTMESGCFLNFEKKFVIKTINVYISTGSFYDLISEEKCQSILKGIDRKKDYDNLQFANLYISEMPKEEVSSYDEFLKIVSTFHQF